jgi:hypothetical protein
MQKRYSFDKVTLIKILKGAMIAGGGAFSVYLLQALAMLDLGEWTSVVGAICAILINAIKEFIQGK